MPLSAVALQAIDGDFETVRRAWTWAIAQTNADTVAGQAIGFVGVLLGAGNAAGGYVVTERMLDMFKSSKKPEGKA